MTDRVLKSYLKDKYYIKVKRTKGFFGKYYTLSYMYDSQGGSWSATRKNDEFGDKLANKLFNSISEIIDVLEGDKEHE